MPIYQKSWWKHLFKKTQQHQKPTNSLKDIIAIKETLLQDPRDHKIIIKKLQQLEKLEQERKVAKQGLIHINLETQAVIMDSLLERYNFFVEDVLINEQRLHQIAQNILKESKRKGLKDLVKERNMKWKV